MLLYLNLGFKNVTSLLASFEFDLGGWNLWSSQKRKFNFLLYSPLLAYYYRQ